MRKLIDIVEGADAISDAHFQFHMSVEPDLIPGKTFDDQTRVTSQAGARGEAGGEGIYTTRNLSYWVTQLAYEAVGEFPRFIYLVRVADPGEGSVWAAHQDCSPPGDVMVLTLIDIYDDDPDGPMPDIGKTIWKANRWLAAHMAGQ